MLLGVPVVRHDILPFGSVGACDNCVDPLIVGTVEHFVRQPWLDVEHVTLRVDDRLAAAWPVLVPHATLKQVNHHVEIDMDVRLRDTPRTFAG